MAIEPQTELLSSLESLFADGLYSDLLVICGNDQHRVHRAIVCPRSKFFAAACNGVFKEGNTGTIHLEDDDPLAVKFMIHYLYHLDYVHGDDVAHPHPHPPDAEIGRFTFARSKPPKLPPAEDWDEESKKDGMFGIESIEVSNLTIHAKVYALAEKYDIPGLKSIALEKFRREVDIWWMSSDFLRAAEEVYSSTIAQDRPMRDIVVETFIQHSVLLDGEAAQNTVRSLDLCYDLMMRFRSRSIPASSPFAPNRRW